ncbi:hypothetical protein FRB91_001918 [Serendipita sp. 411]|nr:hypothetical protein FRB91_001918 [Serendipita sp. 411]
MTRSDSSELSSSVSKHSAHSSMMTDQASSITAETTDRNRFKKRKLEEGGPASTNGPKLTSTNTARSAKRRK